MIYSSLEDEIYSVSEQVRDLKIKLKCYLEDDNIPSDIRKEILRTAKSEGIYEI